MNQVIELFDAHGVLSVFLAVFVEQLGAPIPAVPFLMLAGAKAAGESSYLMHVLLAATAASVLADVFWFFAGRKYGRSVVGLLCRISLSPDTCVRKTEMSFSRRGAWTIVLAKFIPGASTVARPLAGAMGMRLRDFMVLNLAGTLLWAGSSVAAGLVLHSQIRQAVQALEDLGGAAMLVIAALLALYIGWRFARRLVARRMLGKLPRLTAESLAALRDRGDGLIVLDVRSRDSSDLARVAGAVQAPLDGEWFKGLAPVPDGVALVTYCDCPGDATAAKAAMLLAKRGYEVKVLQGGVASWMAAGLPMEAGLQPQPDEAAGLLYRSHAQATFARAGDSLHTGFTQRFLHWQQERSRHAFSSDTTPTAAAPCAGCRAAADPSGRSAGG